MKNFIETQFPWETTDYQNNILWFVTVCSVHTHFIIESGVWLGWEMQSVVVKFLSSGVNDLDTGEPQIV